MNRIYAGVGSREIPYEQGMRLKLIAQNLSARGFTLRSGKARGSDKIFELHHAGPQDLITANDELPDEAFKIARDHCEGFDKYTDAVKRLMARNVPIFLGRDLKTHVGFSVLWSPARETDFGGSAMGMRVCMTFNIPYFNIDERGKNKALRTFVRTMYNA